MTTRQQQSPFLGLRGGRSTQVKVTLFTAHKKREFFQVSQEGMGLPVKRSEFSHQSV